MSTWEENESPIAPLDGMYDRCLKTITEHRYLAGWEYPTNDEFLEDWRGCSFHRFFNIFDFNFTQGGFLHDPPHLSERRFLYDYVTGGTNYYWEPHVVIDLEEGTAGTVTLKHTFKVPFFLHYNIAGFPDSEVYIDDLTTGEYCKETYNHTNDASTGYVDEYGRFGSHSVEGGANGSTVSYTRPTFTRWSFGSDGRSTGAYSTYPYGHYYWFAEDPVIFPPTSELRLRFVLDDCNAISLNYFWIQAYLWGNPSIGEIWAQAPGYWAPESPLPWTMSGQISGPCVGLGYADPAGGSGTKAQVMWCGYACSHEESLRESFVAEVGRAGFLLDESHDPFYMITNAEELAPYHNCDPDVDLFIQTIPSTSKEHLYSFRPSEGTVWGDGMLEGSDLIFPYATDHAQFDLASEDEYWRMVGPKNIISYGLSGDVWHYWVMNSAQEVLGNITLEPDAPLTADTDSVWIDTDGTEPGFFAFELGERTTGYTMYTHGTVDIRVARSFPYQNIKDNYFCGIELVENGTTYDVYLNVYSFNFTTEAIVEESSTLLWSDEPRPLTYSFGGRIQWVPTHGTDGRLYISQIHWTGSKSNEGRVRVFNWSDSTNTFTEGTAFTWAQRNGYAGTCIGWDDYSDHLLVGMLIDEIWGMDSTGSNINQYDGRDRDSECGLAFAVGDGTIVYQNTTVPRIYMGNYGVSGFSSMDNLGSTQTSIYRNLVMDSGGYGYDGRQPHFTAMTDAGSIKTTYYYYTGWSLSTSAYAACKCNNSRIFQADSLYYRKGTNHYRFTDPYLEAGVIGEADNTYPFTADFSPMHYAVIVDDGSDEYIISIIPNTNQLSKTAFWTKIGEKSDDHTHIGRWWVSMETDVHTGVSITDLARSYYYQSANECYVQVIFKLDNDPLYYSPKDTVAGLDSWSTWQLAFDNTSDASFPWLSAEAVADLDISETDSITWWFILEKRFCESSPQTTPDIKTLDLELETPGKPEPTINMHFGEGEEITEIYKNTSEQILIYTAVTPDAQAIDMVVSGTFMRPPLW